MRKRHQAGSGRSWSSLWSPISSGFPLDCSKILWLPQHLCNSIIPFLFEMQQQKFSSWKSKVCHSQVAGNIIPSFLQRGNPTGKNSRAWCLVFACTTHSQFGILWQISAVKEHERDLLSPVELRAIPKVSLLLLGKIPGH